MKHLLLSILISLGISAQNLKNGDIVFITNPSGQGKAIQLATKSKFTHVGIVFIEDGKPYVYHAVEPVSKNTFEEFINLSEDGKFHVKRLKDQSLLTKNKISQLNAMANDQLGKHYDMAFNWSDEEMYCSEFVWKLYNKVLHLDLGETKPLKNFDLSHPTVKSTLTERYGKKIPLDEPMISPGDIYTCELLDEYTPKLQ